MKKALFTLCFSLLVAAAFAQELAVYSQYQIHPVLINPGYTGFENKHEVIANVHSAWTGFTGAPTAYTLVYTAPVGDKLALGGGIFSEKAGNQNVMKLQLNYAFRFQIQKARIGLGLSTDFINKHLKSSLLDNPLVQTNDDIIEQSVDGQSIFDATIGTHMVYDDRFFVSLSLPNAIRTRIDDVLIEEPDAQRSSLFEHYIFQFGYIADIASQNFKVIPSLTMRNVRDTPYQIDLNVQGRFLDEKLIAGLTLRPNNQGSMAFLLGSKYQNFQVTYSYDVAFSRFQKYNSGSHEISLSYAIARKAKTGVEQTGSGN
ncbi:MAG: PorP/SprF family type IX secretion system membrane protein [Saprospiraceae bacterium]